MSYHLQAPFSPALQASKLWNMPPPEPGRIETDPFLVSRRADDISLARDRNYGGLNAGPDTTMEVNYDPRTRSMRAPLEGGTIPGTRHGPSAFDSSDDFIMSKVQRSLPGDKPLTVDALELFPRTRPCTCVAYQCGIPPFTPYSMATLVYSVGNAVQLRAMMVGAGLVRLSPAMAMQDKYPCVCAVFGDEDELSQKLFESAFSYSDTPIIRTPNPTQVLNVVNTAYVNNMLDSIRYNTNAKLAYNYAKVEGNRAYLQEFPQYIDTTPQGTKYVDWQLRDPHASARNIKQLACMTGLPLTAPKRFMAPEE